MPERKEELLKRRETDIKAYYAEHKSKHPQWYVTARMEHVAYVFYLEADTVSRIINDTYLKDPEPNPNQITIFDQLEAESQ